MPKHEGTKGTMKEQKAEENFIKNYIVSEKRYLGAQNQNGMLFPKTIEHESSLKLEIR